MKKRLLNWWSNAGWTSLFIAILFVIIYLMNIETVIYLYISIGFFSGFINTIIY